MIQHDQDYQYTCLHWVFSVINEMKIAKRWQVSHKRQFSKTLIMLICAILSVYGLKGSHAQSLQADSSIPQLTPVPLTGIQQISAGGATTCAITTAGAVKCWGDNHFGQLGNDSDQLYSLIPVDVHGLQSGVTKISVGTAYACALRADGGIKCWGKNDSGQLGNGTFEHSAVPVEVVGLTEGAIDIQTGNLHTCAITAVGGTKCWGNDLYGKLGNGELSSSAVPTDVIGLSTGTLAVTVGGSHTCALTLEKNVKCWGYNFHGELGDNSTLNREAPVDVEGLTSTVKAITAGAHHTCAIMSDESAMCWGYNAHGELGNGTNENQIAPVKVLELGMGAGRIDSKSYHTCALTNDNIIKCWGVNSKGQLGNGTDENRALPDIVNGLPNNSVRSITVGVSHTCAVSTDNRAMCWGYNAYGEVGDGTKTIRQIPVNVLDALKTYIPFIVHESSK